MNRFLEFALPKTLREKNDGQVQNSRHFDVIWLVLMVLTVFSALIAEVGILSGTEQTSASSQPEFWITLLVCVIILIKARLVIDHFMELTEASPIIYWFMTAYFYVFPALAILTWLFPDAFLAMMSFYD